MTPLREVWSLLLDHEGPGVLGNLELSSGVQCAVSYTCQSQ